ncbi:MAG TPA: Crp/Fnr family transcriptional regulator [Cyanobacteria bacterium UBA11049]|nr:Crp/Fnr family transcriptional regulator [Cyanobacteria bacterium UBA11049]
MPPDLSQNRLLAALPVEERDRLIPHLQPVVFDFKEILYDVNEPIEYVYFLLSGIVSLVIVLEDGSLIEVCTIGHEGFVGIPVFLGADQAPNQALSQISGTALRMTAAAFKREVTPETILYNLLLRYTQAVLNQTSQMAACNKLHSLEERFCRWILMVQNGLGKDQFPLTQEFIAQMLGVRRASVSVVAAAIQKAELIQYSRGQITILDREGLEGTACECYSILKTEFDRLIGNDPKILP